MTLTVKLHQQLERALEKRCERDRSSKSAVVRDLIEAYVRARPHKTPWQAYLEVHGGSIPQVGRPRKLGAADHSRLIKDKLRAQHNRAR